ncbi:MAG: DAK2 domain-containing protein [Thermomicrobiales bacterium]
MNRQAAEAAGVWNGQHLLDAVSTASQWLDANRDQLNALNVFPVPDGDTGTNMSLTLRAGVDEANKLSPEDRTGAGVVAARIAHGSLMGARGNSGVILSQVLRGFAKEIDGLDEINGLDIARGLYGAQLMAYRAVMEPVEGTMLTVIRVAAERAATAAASTPALDAILTAAETGAKDALANTPRLLDMLRQAGVVDAGGQGLCVMLDGIHRFARGEALPKVTAFASLGAEMNFLDRIDDLHGEDAFGYCTNFIIFGKAIPFETMRAEIAEMGQSAVIVGDESIVRVHLHSLNPGQLLDYAIQYGDLDQIKIDNMSLQTGTLTAQRAAFSSRNTQAFGKQTVLAVAAGDGISEALRSLGADEVVRGGQTMNPSIEELLEAVERALTNDVILLPNNPNVVLAAEQIPDLTTKHVQVVPSRSIPQGLAALTTFNAEASIDANVAEMTEALAAVHTVEISRAGKDASANGVDVKRSQVIGLVDDRLVAGGDDLNRVTIDTLNHASLDRAELVTIFYGHDATQMDAEQVRALILERYPKMMIEVYDGGQPHYRFVISVE